MSKLGFNDNDSKQNYFPITEEVYSLIKIILTELYSKEISDLGVDLLYNGCSTLFDIQSRLKLSFENLRNFLIIMLQNNLIQKKIITRNDVKLTSYELKYEQFLNILLFPRTLNFIEKKYGNYGRMIFEQFIRLGILTIQQLVEQIQNDPKTGNGNVFEIVKTQVVDLFIKLYEDNLIIYSERANEEENYYTPPSSKKNNNLLGNKEELKKSNKKSLKKNSDKKGKSNKKTKNQKENIKNKNIKLNEDEEEDEEDDGGEQNQEEKKINKNEEFYENNTKNNMHFYINFEQILAEFKSEIVIDYINNNISHQAALLSGFLLKKHKISAFMLGKTTPILIDDISKSFKSLTLNQIEEIIKNNNEIFVKSGYDVVCLDLKKVKKDIKDRSIKNLIITKFSNEHFRVYNLLNLEGALDGKNIMDLCLLAPKRINHITNSLIQEGFIKNDYVNYNGNNILFYSVDEYQTTSNIMEIDFKIINNYKSYYNEQLNNIKNKYRDIKKNNEDLEKLTYIIDQICENILIMKFF